MLEANDTNHIATLNYDLGVETAAQLGELSVDTGITKWRGGLRWRWDLDNPDVKLLKLHGSLNWGRPYGEGGYLARRCQVVEATSSFWKASRGVR